MVEEDGEDLLPISSTPDPAGSVTGEQPWGFVSSRMGSGRAVQNPFVALQAEGTLSQQPPPMGTPLRVGRIAWEPPSPALRRLWVPKGWL